MQCKQIGGIISSIKAISITFIVPLKLLLDTLVITYTTIVVKRWQINT